MFNRSSAAISTNVEESAISAHPSRPAYLPLSAENITKAQAQSLGVGEDQVKAAELRRGAAVDSRVSPLQLEAISSTSATAQQNFYRSLAERTFGSADRLKILFAPTSRSIDHLIHANGLEALIQDLVRQGRSDELLRAIDLGPGEGKIWDEPKTQVELVASLVRWGVLREHDKKRVRVSAEIREWIFDAVTEAGLKTTPRLGGASAVGTELARVLGHEPTMMALGKVPGEVLGELSPKTRVVGTDAKVEVLGDIPLEADFCGHFALTTKRGDPILPKMLGEVRVDGRVIINEDISKLDFIISGSKSVQGFDGVTLERMEEVAKDYDMAVLTGVQHLSSAEAVEDYISRMKLFSNERVPVVLLYSEARHPELESLVWSKIKQAHCLNLLALNSFEAVGVLERIHKSITAGNPLEISPEQKLRIELALKLAHTKPEHWEDGHESPEWLFESGTLLQEVLNVPMVRVRGMVSDTLVIDRLLIVDKPEAVRDSMIVARNLGTLKVASASGLIRDRSDLRVLETVPDGTYLAALHKISDCALAFAPQGVAASSDAELLPYRGYARLSDGRLLLAVPPVQFYIKDGGTQSAGDVMDVTFASEQLPVLFGK